MRATGLLGVCFTGAMFAITGIEVFAWATLAFAIGVVASALLGESQD